MKTSFIPDAHAQYIVRMFSKLADFFFKSQWDVKHIDDIFN